MRILEGVLVRIVQLASMLFFTFAVFVYAGALVVIPLAALMAVIKILSAIGFNGVFATIVAIPALAWVLLKLHNVPRVTQTLLDTGWALVRAGADNFRTYDDIAKQLKGGSTSTATQHQ